MKKVNLEFFIRFISISLCGLFIYLTFSFFNSEMISGNIVRLLSNPWTILIMVTLYFSAFLLRAYAWRVYLAEKVALLTCLYGLFYSLLINHLLPIKVGDLVRIGVITKKENISLDEAAHSVFMMRLLDMLTLLTFSAAGIFYLSMQFSLQLPLLLTMVAVSISVFAFIILFLYKKKNILFKKHLSLFNNAFNHRNAPKMLLAIILSWALEGVVILGVAQAFQSHISIVEAIWVNSLTVGGQVFQITPGGIATYETVMTFGLVALGMSWEQSYSFSVLSHVFKFLFSYIMGIFVLIKLPIHIQEMKRWIRRKGVKST
ncbi:flippase-like domain-containing protein [Bacillus timonensis]|nr:flippase-like domain-containing protein [Bacillus timonensis]